MSKRRSSTLALLLGLAALAALVWAGASLSQTRAAQGDTLIIADADVSNSVDPDGAAAVYIPNHNAYVNLYDRLFEQQPIKNPLGVGNTISVKTYPMLAKSATLDKNGNGYTVQLRQGVKSAAGN